jgi:hypothetical protein
MVGRQLLSTVRQVRGGTPKPSRWVQGTVAGVGATLSLGCSVIVDASREQCSSTSDCVARGPAFARSACIDSLCQEPVGPWRCLTNPVEPALPTTSTVRASLQVCDSLRGCSSSLTQLTARLCAKLDPGCSNPILANISNDNGVFEFDAPTGMAGFDGYLEVSAPPVLCTDSEVFGGASATVCALLPQCDRTMPDQRCAIPPYSRTLRFFNPPLVADAQLPPLMIVSTASSLGIAQAAGVAYDPTQGGLLVTALDCDGMGAAGLTFSIDEHPEGTVQMMYLENNIPTRARQETDATGIGLFVGVPVGFVNVAARNAMGIQVGSVGAHVAPASNSFTTLVP